VDFGLAAVRTALEGGGAIAERMPMWHRNDEDALLSNLQGFVERQKLEQEDPITGQPGTIRQPLREGEL